MALRHSTSFSFATGGGNSGHIEYQGAFVLELASCPSGATVAVKHSTDDGATYTVAKRNADGDNAEFTSAGVFVLDMPVAGVRTRIEVTGAYTGTCAGKIGY